MRGLRLSIFRDSGRGLREGGIFAKGGWSAVTWVPGQPYNPWEQVIEPPPRSAVTDDAPPVVLVVDRVVDRVRVRAIPAQWYAGPEHRWAVFGGEFVWSDSNRFRDFLTQAGSDIWAVPLFDKQD